ncbi:recombinase family protein [Bacillus massiliglaciei]|uniref:recombinase family protein n=1 Tax=Bacillus massiliglaciei TaxID=1816693 RepID=UPI000A67C407|nr:recombinase family protein [Bacillus massiliglaciei]
MVKAALYIRVSTQEQIENYSIEVQRERLEAYCKAKNWEVQDFYIDGGFSGSTLERPDLQRMLKNLKEIDAVVVYKLDRLSRSQKDTLELIEEHFLKNDVDFVSITETLDTSSPFGKAMIGILSVFAQLERETIAERMRMGHIKRAENGLRVMGGDYDPAGYARVDGHLVLKEDESKHIKRAFDLYEAYHSITIVQKNLKEEGYPVWRFRRYRDILSNPLYIGQVKFAGELYQGQHDPIVTEEQFDRVQALLRRHKGNNAHKAKTSLLSGLLGCSCCGESFVAYSTGISKKNKKNYYYYICKARRFPSEYETKCVNKIWSKDKIESLVLEELKNMLLKKSTDQKKRPTVDYNKLLKDVDRKIERLIQLYTNEKIDNNLLEKQLSKLTEEKNRIINKQTIQEEDTFIISEDMLDNIKHNLDVLDFPDKRAIVQSCIRQIYIEHDHVKIDWRF